MRLYDFLMLKCATNVTQEKDWVNAAYAEVLYFIYVCSQKL